MPVKPAQHQLDAYNDKNIESFLEAYSSNVKIFDYPDRLSMTGIVSLRTHYTKLFNDYPKMQAYLNNRIEFKNYVIDHEFIAGRIENKEIEVIAIYQIEDGLIQNVWFIR